MWKRVRAYHISFNCLCFILIVQMETHNLKHVYGGSDERVVAANAYNEFGK
jgi:hypothetical protein